MNYFRDTNTILSSLWIVALLFFALLIIVLVLPDRIRSNVLKLIFIVVVGIIIYFNFTESGKEMWQDINPFNTTKIENIEDKPRSNRFTV